jgi:hypothetical protein
MEALRHPDGLRGDPWELPLQLPFLPANPYSGNVRMSDPTLGSR